jgi:hypothetical protein
MAIQMTRAEYEATYGVKPTFSKVEEFDTTPAPTLMTRAEYNAKYRPETMPPTKEEVRKGDWRYKVGDFIVNKTPIGIPFKMVESAKSGAERFKTGVEQTVEGTQGNKPTLLGRGILNEIGGGLGIAFSPITGLVSWGAGLPGIKQTVSAVDKYLIQPTADKISDNPYIQSLAIAVPQDVAENTLILGMSLFGGSKSKPIQAPIKGAIKDVEYSIVGGGPQNKTGIIPKAQTAIETFQQGRKTAKITETAGILSAIENNYAGLRNAKKFEKNADESLQRIAKAHEESGLLNDIVDTTGTINTSNAVRRYAAETVDGSEGVVRQNLALEKQKVNIAEVERELISKIDPAFEGAALTNALNGIRKEIAGLRSRADEFGDILLEKIQDAKVQTNSGIDYKKETTNAIKYKKLVANTYKTIIENKSQFKVTINGKQYGVKEINEALSKFYQDMDRLHSLDGRKVAGGKLGKYFAQISGNIVGGLAGGVVGGMPGSAIGTVVGGELAGYLKGKGMAGTFSRGGEGMLEKNPLLVEAKLAGKRPAEVNLKVADPVVGAPKGIIKTKEIIEVEAQIRKNVEAQKKAIKAGDFGLVATLKEIYKALFGKLKDLIKQIKETPNKKGGFVKNPLDPQSYNRGNLNKQYNANNTTSKTSISKPTIKSTPESNLLSEAKKIPESLTYLEKQAKGVSYETFKRNLVKNIGSVKAGEKISDDVAQSVWERLQKTAQRGEFGDEATLFKDMSGRNPKRLVGDEMVTVYRATPVNKIRAGDFVSTSKNEAGFYTSETKKIYPFKVKKSDLVSMEGSMGGEQELIFIPKGSKQGTAVEYFKSPKDFWNKANKK